MKNSNYFMNPYFAGFLLGLVLLASFYLTGRGLGASGAVKSVVVTMVEEVAPNHAAKGDYYKKYSESHPESPLKDWLLFLAVGVVIGGFVSGSRAERIAFKFEKGERASNAIRVVGALAGGALFGFGAQLGRGCTSGAALSGMAVLSTAGFITMLAIFGSGFVFAYFFRKLWI
jgi:uncharacterized membrane protein YedE/YeeE